MYGCCEVRCSDVCVLLKAIALQEPCTSGFPARMNPEGETVLSLEIISDLFSPASVLFWLGDGCVSCVFIIRRVAKGRVFGRMESQGSESEGSC